MAAEAKVSTGRIRGFYNRVVKFLKEVRAEMRKVAWPSRRQLTIYTVVVIGSVAVVAVFLGVADLILSFALNLAK